MRTLILFFLSFTTLLSGQEEAKTWAQEIADKPYDEAHIGWIKEQLRQQIPIIQKRSQEIAQDECKTCQFSTQDMEHESGLLIFMSFSVPIESWLSLSAELKTNSGVFLIRGLPNNSFQELASKIIELKERGFDGTIQIDPISFREYGVINVPTFVQYEKDKFDKVEGNISLSSVLNLFKTKGELEAR